MTNIIHISTYLINIPSIVISIFFPRPYIMIPTHSWEETMRGGYTQMLLFFILVDSRRLCVCVQSHPMFIAFLTLSPNARGKCFRWRIYSARSIELLFIHIIRIHIFELIACMRRVYAKWREGVHHHPAPLLEPKKFYLWTASAVLAMGHPGEFVSLYLT